MLISRVRFGVRLAMTVFLAGVINGCTPLLFFLPGLQNAEQAGWIVRWNRVAVDASGLDHTPVAAGESRTFGHHLGPTKSSRAMAIVHIAMFEAVNAINGGFQSYTGTTPSPGASLQAAIAQAAHDALVGLYPSHRPVFDQALAVDLAAIPDDPSKLAGIAVGQQAAALILSMRTGDGSDVDNPYIFSNDPGKWRVDPINPTQQPLGDEWPLVPPFVLSRANQFRSPPPPSIASAEYAEAYNEAKAIGGDGVTTPTIRTAEQTQIGLYWAYDGTPSLCAPPRLYNQIAVQLATERGLGVVDMARLLALVNVAMADAGIAVWESKYFYNYWRPVTAIREADAGAGPSGLGDANPLTTGDAAYVPLCAPASNLTAPNFTPPFPAYPSGHAGFGGALFQVLRDFFGTDNIPFTFVSDELNGVTVDNQGATRPLVPRSFSTLTQAESENGESRIYLGIHWRFDKDEGIVLGNRVGNYVFTHIYQRVP